MPEMHFNVTWPNGATTRYYSPSYIIEEYLTVGSTYTVPDFVGRLRTALNIASDRVMARYGFACSAALDELGAIEEAATALSAEETRGDVLVVSFEKHPPRDARKKSAEHFDVAVVGGGQAGLATSYLLKERGIAHIVLEANRVAHAWRSERWDSFCLVTPNFQCRLPGHPYTGNDPKGFMLKDEIVEYVESYARKFELPVREGVRVTRVSPTATGTARFELDTTTGTVTAAHVVVAAGGYHHPAIPECGRALPESIVQVHSAAYENPAALPEGAVLVVGTGQSGCQIAEDLHLAGRRVHLAVGNAPRCARRHRGRDVVEWLEEMGHYDAPYSEQKNGEQLRERANHYVTGRGGGHDIDLRQFALEGMRLHGPLVGVTAGKVCFAPRLAEYLDAADDVYRSINRTIDAYIAKEGIAAPPGEEYEAPWHPGPEPTELDLEAAGITSVVWCTGFTTDFSFLELPVLDDRGRPVHDRGVTNTPGLYFVGLPWLYTWGSGRFSGVARDAAHIVEHLAAFEETPVRSVIAPASSEAVARAG